MNQRTIRTKIPSYRTGIEQYCWHFISYKIAIVGTIMVNSGFNIMYTVFSLLTGYRYFDASADPFTIHYPNTVF